MCHLSFHNWSWAPLVLLKSFKLNNFCKHFLKWYIKYFTFFSWEGGCLYTGSAQWLHIFPTLRRLFPSACFHHQFITHYNCRCDHSHLCWYALYLQIWRQLIRLLWINCKSTNVWFVLVFVYCSRVLDCSFVWKCISTTLYFFLFEILKNLIIFLNH